MVHAGATSADTRGRKAPRYVAGLRSTTIRALAGDPLSPRRGIRLPLRRRTLGRGLRWRTHHDHLDLLGRTAEWRWNALQGPGHRDPGAGRKIGRLGESPTRRHQGSEHVAREHADQAWY